MQEPILIARSKTRERMDVDEGQSWTEYRASLYTLADWCAMQRAGFEPYVSMLYRKWVLETRYVSTGPGAREDKWTPWQLGSSLDEVIRDGLGDTSFFEAESLCPEHAAAVRQLKTERIALEKCRLATEAYQAAEIGKNEFERACNLSFNKAIAKCKDADAVDKVRQRLQKKHRPQHDRLYAAVTQAAASLKVAKLDLKVLQGRLPSGDVHEFSASNGCGTE